MIDRIQQLERLARQLEPAPPERQHLRNAVVAQSEDFLEGLPTRKTFNGDASQVASLLARPFSDAPSNIEDLLSVIDDAVIGPGLSPASGGHMGYIPGGGLFVSALGDYLAAVTNEYAGVSFTGPGAVAMENSLLNWMSALVGYPESSAGNLASGGSIASLIALVTARDAKELQPRDYDRAVVYLSAQAHHCLDKALRIAGIGTAPRRIIPLDDQYRMIPAELEQCVSADRAAGLIPWLLIASAGTTDTGAIDPLGELADLAHTHGLWFHVDGAYGAFFALCQACRPKLAGMADSDSIVMDPHKGLFLPYGTGAVLVKDRQALHRAHDHQADYMQDLAQAEGDVGLSPAELSPELSKHFRGLRCWLPLKVHGLAPFRASLEEKLLLAQYFHQEVQKLGFEVGPPPELSVVTYRWVPRRGDPDAFYQALVDAVHQDGRIFLSSSRLNGRFILRMAALCFRTHLATIDLTLRVLREKVAELGG